MAVTLHALTLVLLPLITVGAIVRYPRRRWFPETSNAWGFLIIFFYFSASVILFTCLCDHSGPWLRQTFVPLACMIASLLFIGSPRVRVSMILLGLVTGFALQAHLSRLIDTPGWAYDQKRFLTPTKRNQIQLKSLGDEVAELGKHDNILYAAGWLRDLPIPEQSRPYVDDSFADCRYSRLWHSPITGLLHVECTALDVWYPGGTLAEAAEKLELRHRPDLLQLLDRQEAAHRLDASRTAKRQNDKRAMADEGLRAARLLGEYAWSHDGRLPETWKQLIDSLSLRSGHDGSEYYPRTYATIVNPSRFRWPPNTIVPKLDPNGTNASEAPSATLRLLWTSDDSLTADELEGLTYRIRWIRTYGPVVH